MDDVLLKLLTQRSDVGALIGKSLSLDVRASDFKALVLSDGAGDLDFRQYLFAQQCRLLMLLGRPDEVASRAFPFIRVRLPLAANAFCFTPTIYNGVCCTAFRESGINERSLHD